MITLRAYSAERILLPLQKWQHEQSVLIGRGALSSDLRTNFREVAELVCFYSGRIDGCKNNSIDVRNFLVNVLVVCIASANSMNLSIGEHIAGDFVCPDIDVLARELGRDVPGDGSLSGAANVISSFGEQMSKVADAMDRFDPGDHRSDMENLVVQLSIGVLGVLGHLGNGLESAIRTVDLQSLRRS